MRAQQSLWTAHSGWTGDVAEAADLLLVFGGATPIKDETHWRELSRRHPKALRLGCSTGGEIHGRNVLDESLSVTALNFGFATESQSHDTAEYRAVPETFRSRKG